MQSLRNVSFSLSYSKNESPKYSHRNKAFNNAFSAFVYLHPACALEPGMNVWIDIETIPKPMEDWELQEVLEKGRSKVLKDPAKIAEADEETIAKLGLHPAKFRVCAVALSVDYESQFGDGACKLGDRTACFAGSSEKEVLDWLSSMINYFHDEIRTRAPRLLRSESIKWCGHNICDFDLPRLRLAFARHPELGQPFATLPKPWETYDTCSAQSRVSLDDLAIELLGPEYLLSRKKGLGKTMAEAVAQGRWTEIEEYCAYDADLSRRVGKLMFGL